MKKKAANPLNNNQKYLISFFNGKLPLSDETIDIFLTERRGPDYNYPLFQKYFKSSNKHLLSLILHGLLLYPVREELLLDLAYYHQFQGILNVLTERYIIACEQQEDLEAFSELVMDFYYATIPDGYNPLYTLKERYPIGTNKREIVDFLNELAIGTMKICNF